MCAYKIYYTLLIAAGFNFIMLEWKTFQHFILPHLN